MRTLLIVVVALMMAGCSDSDDGGSSGGAGAFDCAAIAGNNQKYRSGNAVVTVNVTNDCQFAANSTATGQHRGTLTRLTTNTWTGTGTTAYCASGKFQVTVAKTPQGTIFEDSCI